MIGLDPRGFFQSKTFCDSMTLGCVLALHKGAHSGEGSKAPTGWDGEHLTPSVCSVG